MQNHHDERFTAVVYTHGREFEPWSLTTDDFANALRYVVGGDSCRDTYYGIVIDNRLKKTVFRYNSHSWSRHLAKEVLV